MRADHDGLRGSTNNHRSDLSGGQRAVYFVAALDEFAHHRAARRAGRRSGHVAGHRRHAAASRDYRLQVDCHRAGAGHHYRCAARESGDDRGAAADRRESRIWRALRNAGGDRGILSAGAQRSTVYDGGAGHGSDSRFADVYGKFDGGREATGDFAAAAADVSGTERGEPWSAGGGHRAGGLFGRASGSQARLSIYRGHPVAFRRFHGDSDWRRGHAHSDFAAERLRRTFGRGHGICLE